MSFSAQTQVNVVIVLAIGLAWLWLASRCARGSGRASERMAAGAGALAVVTLLSGVARGLAVFGDSPGLLIKISDDYVPTVLSLVELGGVLLLVVGFVAQQRGSGTGPTDTSSGS